MAEKALVPYSWTLNEVFGKAYVVPVYQRPYSWEDKQINDLLDDLFEAYSNKENESDGLFTGTIYLHSTKEKIEGVYEKFEIIDGQQRISTFSLILLALYSLSIKYDFDQQDETIISLRSALWKKLNRKNMKEYPVIELNSLEKEIFKDIFDHAFTKADTLYEYLNNYNTKCAVERLVVNNYKTIFNILKEKFVTNNEDREELLRFIDFVLFSTSLVAIEVNTNKRKVFSMFESINSKGKHLEDIDLIKTHIFSRLNEEDYNEYLKKWGELIIRTNDNLYDYFYNYVKAFICFYRQSIGITNFKALSKDSLKKYYGKMTEEETFKAMIDDMLDKVDYYAMLDDCDKAYGLVRNKEFRFYYKVFTLAAYKHPKALFLRALCDYGQGLIEKDQITKIVSIVVKFMIKFLTISSRDSKDAITIFNNLMNQFYDKKPLDETIVTNLINNELIRVSVTRDKVTSELQTMDLYSSGKIIAKFLLSLFESTSYDEEISKWTTSFDNAYSILDTFEDSYSFDHLLPQNPSKDNADYKYYSEVVDGIPVLVLKDGHDFDINVTEGMDYNIFKQIVLHRVGNLKIKCQDENSIRQNNTVVLKNYGKFTSNNDIIKRTNEIINVLFDRNLL